MSDSNNLDNNKAYILITSSSGVIGELISKALEDALDSASFLTKLAAAVPGAQVAVVNHLGTAIELEIGFSQGNINTVGDAIFKLLYETAFGGMGAAFGAVLGSEAPLIGQFVGSLTGGLLGGAWGESLGDQVWNSLFTSSGKNSVFNFGNTQIQFSLSNLPQNISTSAGNPISRSAPQVTETVPQDSIANLIASNNQTSTQPSTPITTTASDGSTVTTSYSGNTASINTSKGFQETLTYSADSSTVIGDTWTNAIGTQGTDTYNADGSSSSTVTYADGNYATTLDDGQGNITTDYYTKDGVEIRSTWVHSDGSSGTVALYADGQTQIPGAGTGAVPPSSFTVLQNPNGTYTTTGWNAQDHSTTTQFDTNGNQTALSTGSGTGVNDQTVASQSTVFVPQTSSTEGIEQTTTYNSSGQQIGVSWYAAYADGTVDPNGTSVYLATGAEATGTGWGWSGVMAAAGTETFNASGVQTLDIKALDGTSWVVTNEQQGSTVSHESSSGALLSDQWAIADGPGVISSVPASASVTGSDTFNADGSGTGSFSDARDGTAGTVTLTESPRVPWRLVGLSHAGMVA